MGACWGCPEGKWTASVSFQGRLLPFKKSERGKTSQVSPAMGTLRLSKGCTLGLGLGVLIAQLF